MSGKNPLGLKSNFMVITYTLVEMVLMCRVEGARLFIRFPGFGSDFLMDIFYPPCFACYSKFLSPKGGLL